MTKQITSFFALTTFVLAASGSAFAADIAVKAPLPAPTPVYSWTGWYVGGNLGASFGRAKTDFNAVPITLAPPVPPFPAAAVWSPTQSTQVDSSVVVRSATIGSIPH
jgi:opacity protein-like surface antigen